MKTEPTEALRAIANDLKYNTGLIHSNIQLLIEESFISGVKYGQSNPKIKQLEWEKGDGEYWEAITPIGAYSITLDSGIYEALYDMDNDVDGEWGSLAKAKAAAQADFEKRVKECLE
mgnify:FL=1|jgi:hypothetical protein